MQTLQKTMNSICWATRTWNPLLDLGQTLRVLLTIYLFHHAPSLSVSSHCLLKLQLKLSLPQVILFNRKSSPNSKNPVFSVNIQLQQQMGVFKASMLEAVKSLETNFILSKRRPKKWRWIILTLQPLSLVPVKKLIIWTLPLRELNHPHMDEAMEVDLYGPPLPPRLGDDHSINNSDPRHVADQHSG